MQEDPQEAGTGAAGAAAEICAVEAPAEEKKAELVIRHSDLIVVMRETCLGRQDAVDLMQKANGDVKSAMRLYLPQV